MHRSVAANGRMGIAQQIERVQDLALIVTRQQWQQRPASSSDPACSCSASGSIVFFSRPPPEGVQIFTLGDTAMPIQSTPEPQQQDSGPESKSRDTAVNNRRSMRPLPGRSIYEQVDESFHGISCLRRNRQVQQFHPRAMDGVAECPIHDLKQAGCPQSRPHGHRQRKRTSRPAGKNRIAQPTPKRFSMRPSATTETAAKIPM